MTTVQSLIGPNLWVKQDPAWQAILQTVSLPFFSDRNRIELMAYIDLDERSVDWNNIHRLAQGYSQEQQTLLRIAHGLFSGGPCQLAELGTLSSRGRSAAILLIGQRYR